MTAYGRVILTGIMGAGKTRLGRRLAEALGWRFLDADELSEGGAGIIWNEAYGSANAEALRRRRALLQRLVVAPPSDEGVVLACTMRPLSKSYTGVQPEPERDGSGVLTFAPAVAAALRRDWLVIQLVPDLVRTADVLSQHEAALRERGRFVGDGSPEQILAQLRKESDAMALTYEVFATLCLPSPPEPDPRPILRQLLHTLHSVRPSWLPPDIECAK